MLPNLLSASALVALGRGGGTPHSNSNVNTACVWCLDHQKPAKA